LFAELKKNFSLKSLILDKNNMTQGRGFNAIKPSLWINTSFRSISLVDCRIGKYAADVLAEGITKNKNVNYINLDRNQIGDDGARVFAEIIQNQTTEGLVTLILSKNRITDQSGVLLGKAIQFNLVLKTLNLKENELRNETGETFTNSLNVNYTIHSVILEYNVIDLKFTIDIK
jgi:Ran GTPase-activating protein (RanGAP) involved in mRNA processing and transport